MFFCGAIHQQYEIPKSNFGYAVFGKTIMAFIEIKIAHRARRNPKCEEPPKTRQLFDLQMFVTVLTYFRKLQWYHCGWCVVR